MFKRFTFSHPDQPRSEVFAHRVEFTAAHVVFRDPDGEIILAMSVHSVDNLMPERTADGEVKQFTSEEALEHAAQPRKEDGLDWR